MSLPPQAGGHDAVMCNESWLISWCYNIPSKADGLSTDAYNEQSVLPMEFGPRLPYLLVGLYQLCKHKGLF